MLYTDIINDYNIDINKLSRNYSINPIYIDPCGIKSEIPPKNELYYLYIELNIPRKVLSHFYGVKEHNIKLWAKKYNINKSSIQIHNNQIKMLQKSLGVINVSQIDSVKKKRENTNMKLYGCKCAFSCKIFIDKMKNTKLRKYGNPYFTNSEKATKTRNLRKLSKGSGEENTIYDLLIKKYNNVKRWYCEDLRYPFECDFYIPEKDLFIEYQGYPSHGGEAYLGKPKQKEKVKLWIHRYNQCNKKKKYNDWVRVWTKHDVLKRKIVEKNNLNWLEFFNMNQFMEWYNVQ